MLLDRKRVKFWQKWVFLIMAILMAAWLVSIPIGRMVGCGSSSSNTVSTFDAQIVALKRQIKASPAAVAARLELAETYRKRANQQVVDSAGRTSDLQAAAAAYEAYIAQLAKTKGTKAKIKAAERLQVTALEDLATVYLTLKDFTRTARVYGKLTDLRPNNAGYFFDMGRVAINGGDTDTALLAFTRYLELAPDSPEAATIKQWIKDNASGGTQQ